MDDVSRGEQPTQGEQPKGRDQDPDALCDQGRGAAKKADEGEGADPGDPPALLLIPLGPAALDADQEPDRQCDTQMVKGSLGRGHGRGPGGHGSSAQRLHHRAGSGARVRLQGPVWQPPHQYVGRGFTPSRSRRTKPPQRKQV